MNFPWKRQSYIYKKCGYNTSSECPYNSEKDCKFSKEHCHLVEERKRGRKKACSIFNPVTIIIISLLFYALITILKEDKVIPFKYDNYVYTIISGITISFITGALLAIIIDIPSRLKDYEKSFINAIASNGYLKSLDEGRLTKLRNDITEQLHKVSAPNMAKGLIDVDQRICELLRKPYYSRYRQSIICEPSEIDDFVEKKHVIEYKLINPYSVNRVATEYISIKNIVFVKEGEDEKDSIKDLKITCIKDNNESIDFTNRVKLETKSLIDKDEFYNTEIYIETTEQKDNDLRGIRIDFNDNIEIHIEYKIKVHKDDICFTKRLRRPVKNFRLDYIYNDNDRKVFGQIIGTEIKQSDINIKYTSKNSISLETFDWLLPDNGVFVVVC